MRKEAEFELKDNKGGDRTRLEAEFEFKIRYAERWFFVCIRNLLSLLLFVVGYLG